jgi:hypothetical protein
MISATLPCPPSKNDLHILIKNRRTGKWGLARSPAYKAWLKEAGWLAKSQRIQQKAKPVIGRYELWIYVARDVPLDLGNVETAISDLIQEIGWVSNDNKAELINLRWLEVGDGVAQISSGQVYVSVKECK